MARTATEYADQTHERPKVDVFGDTLTIVLRPAKYLEATKSVEFGQITLLASPQHLLVVRRDDAVPLVNLQARMEAKPEWLAQGPGAVLHAIVDEVVEAYSPVLTGIADDIDDVETTVFSVARDSPTQRIYSLKREVLEFGKAAVPLADVLGRLKTLEHPVLNDELRRYFADTNDDVRHVVDQILTDRELLSGALEANLTQVSIRQNEDTRKMSAWAAILAVPTMIAGIYEHELRAHARASQQVRLLRGAVDPGRHLDGALPHVQEVGLALGGTSRMTRVPCAAVDTSSLPLPRMATAGLGQLRTRVLHPLRHAAATAAVGLARETLRWSYVGPEDRDRVGFASFGAGSLIEQPYAVLLGQQYIEIGESTLLAAGATLAAWPESDAAVADGPILEIGDRVWGARGLSIVAHRRIAIGDDVWFGPGVYVTDAGHDPKDLTVPIGHNMEPAQPVHIGNGSWLGAGVVVLPGVSIGDHVAVGANSVVCDDLPSNTVAVGSPARVVRHLDADLSDSRP